MTAATAHVKLVVDNVTKVFGGRRGDGMVALDGVRLHVDEGEPVC